MNSPEDRENSHWQPLEPGTLTGISRRRRRRSTLAQAIAVCGVVALTMVAGYWVSPIWKGSATPVALNCEETMDRMSGFFESRLNESEEKLVRKHLEFCEPCRRKFLREEQARGTSLLASSGKVTYQFCLWAAAFVP